MFQTARSSYLFMSAFYIFNISTWVAWLEEEVGSSRMVYFALCALDTLIPILDMHRNEPFTSLESKASQRYPVLDQENQKYSRSILEESFQASSFQ